MKTKKVIEFYSAAEVLGRYEVDDIEVKDELQKAVIGEDFDPLKFKYLTEEYNLYYCSKHNLFHKYYYETDDSDIYTAASHRPVCPLCLLGIDITA